VRNVLFPPPAFTVTHWSAPTKRGTAHTVACTTETYPVHICTCMRPDGRPVVVPGWGPLCVVPESAVVGL
jgi:hypothetical protein